MRLYHVPTIKKIDVKIAFLLFFNYLGQKKFSYDIFCTNRHDILVNLREKHNTKLSIITGGIPIHLAN